MFFEQFSNIKFFFNVKRKLLLKKLSWLLFYQMLSHCAYLHQGMERISSIIVILELETVKHNKVLFKVLSPTHNFSLKNIRATGKLKVQCVPLYPSPRPKTVKTCQICFLSPFISLYIHITYTTFRYPHMIFLNSP